MFVEVFNNKIPNEYSAFVNSSLESETYFFLDAK